MPDTPLPDIAAVLDRLDADREGALERLFALLRLKSVSTDPAYAEECRRAADWLLDDLRAIGFDARLVETEGHPLVIGHGGPEGGPHVLFYGHYDVQPVDPLELWETDPFEPRIAGLPDGRQAITARGASDDKGQVMTFLEACRAWKAATGSLPCRVTVLLEGEEESGGESLTAYLAGQPEELKAADVALVCDTGMWDPETPAITTQLRGNVTQQVTVTGPSRDLHSGLYGGAAANPIHELTRALAALRDAAGRITLPGFYDGVPELPEELRAQWEGLGFEPGDFLGAVGLSSPAGEQGRSALEQLWSRPTAEINGIWGGYTGAGFKTVIPAEAHAKVSFRLVGEQDPQAVRAAFQAHMRAAIDPQCGVAFTDFGAGKPISMPIEAPEFAKARQALTDEWGREAAFIGSGGSIPVVGQFKRQLGLDSLLIGFGQDDDRIHSPNEKYDLTSFHGGARSWARVLAALAG
ncbi:M20/M25/M40 family metallo-hydrolase [Paralimibaculum aggregatum]|uniref:M20/M25/M40 family metallo-hydrolase n=1 Tax=Paralimibaculum aggregatum TaxID=3036245 RepID=A0ABQ6LQT6_9RHOB|nr:M20/M25/M40 family metallo-hydrolase [Limibaculum sp. NKW23]GMG84472.1 M20/M25/M40 family metallo-hydrolase [Limibaculum sp. NKW23]